MNSLNSGETISCNDREEIHLASHLQSPGCELHYLDTLQPFSCPYIGILSTLKKDQKYAQLEKGGVSGPVYE